MCSKSATHYEPLHRNEKFLHLTFPSEVIKRSSVFLVIFLSLKCPFELLSRNLEHSLNMDYWLRDRKNIWYFYHRSLKVFFLKRYNIKQSQPEVISSFIIKNNFNGQSHCVTRNLRLPTIIVNSKIISHTMCDEHLIITWIKSDDIVLPNTM